MDLAQIKAITFDAAHTLYFPYPSVGAIYAEVLGEFGIHHSETALDDAFRGAFRCVEKDKKILDGEARELSYWKQIVAASLEALGPLPLNFDTLFTALWETFSHGKRWRPEPTAAATLQILRERGYTIGLLTNWDSRVRPVLADTQFDRYFDHLFISSELNAEKPDLEIFRQAQTELGCDAHQILHIGDSLQHDIQGARAAGWQAIRIVDASEANATKAADHITQLDQLLPLLHR